MRYKLFKAEGFFDVLAVGPGDPSIPARPRPPKNSSTTTRSPTATAARSWPARVRGRPHRDLGRPLDGDEQRTGAGGHEKSFGLTRWP